MAASKFRLINLDDLPGMLKWGAHYDPRLEHYSFTDFDPEDIQGWYYAKQRFLTRKLFGLIVDDVAVGFITLKKINFIYRTAEIGIAVNPDEFGKGYGTEMIHSLLAHVYGNFPIETVYLDVAEFNVNARRLYEKCGFMYVGEEMKAYESQANKELITAFPDDFRTVRGTMYAKFLRMSHQKGTLTEPAPAKINLGLRVVGSRNGYHDLVTTMVTVDFEDLVHIRFNKKTQGIRILSRHEGIPEEKNLCYIAAETFLKHPKFVCEESGDRGIEISIYKRIPEGAGMGGGSADAAAVLRALNQLYGYPFDSDVLEEMALKIGSDVPFCVAGGAAIARGRGERLEPFKIDKPLHILIYPPEVKLSTAKVFTEFDRLSASAAEEEKKRRPMIRRSSEERRKPVAEEVAYPEACRLRDLIGKSPDIPESEEERDFPKDDFYTRSDLTFYEKLVRIFPPNDLESAAIRLVKERDGYTKSAPDDVIGLLRENGAVYAAMSGSGPGVYGIFESEFDARIAQKKIPKSIYTITKYEEKSK
ncbi:MAG: 4-(cytidine 5'-diphospho)-2-C-methyl-D-erythritol kinase [Bacillota bacterium]|nr:4-(cytidine 5'-diphospho)-2-C-methyl-D-erythritol kinase [Bacillota bacterium]